MVFSLRVLSTFTAFMLCPEAFAQRPATCPDNEFVAAGSPCNVSTAGCLVCNYDCPLVGCTPDEVPCQRTAQCTCTDCGIDGAIWGCMLWTFEKYCPGGKGETTPNRGESRIPNGNLCRPAPSPNLPPLPGSRCTRSSRSP